MSYSATIKYDRSLVRRALNRYMFSRLGPTFFISLIATLAILALSFFSNIWNWFLSIVGAVLVSVIGFVVFVYIARLRAAEGFFESGDEPVVTFHFDETGVRTQSPLGSVDLKWQVFDEILKFHDVWLIVYAKSGYMTLPLEQVTGECRQFIEARIGRGRK